MTRTVMLNYTKGVALARGSNISKGRPPTALMCYLLWHSPAGDLRTSVLYASISPQKSSSLRIFARADMHVLIVLSHRCSKRASAGVLDCTCEGWMHHHRLHNTPYCQIEPARKPWTFPKGNPVPSPYINAGFFMLMPDRRVAQDLIAKLQEYPATGLAEQDFLNDYFRDRIK